MARGTAVAPGRTPLAGLPPVDADADEAAMTIYINGQSAGDRHAFFLILASTSSK